jgi:putative oxidoreductase
MPKCCYSTWVEFFVPRSKEPAISFFSAVLSLVGRFCVAAIFLAGAAMNKIPNFNQVVGYMEAEGVPRPSIALVGAIAFLIAGGLSVAVGYWTRLGAFLLAVFVAAASYYFHDFWNLADPAAKQEQMTHFMKNLALFGGLVFLVANGGGAGSIDRMMDRKTPAKT